MTSNVEPQEIPAMPKLWIGYLLAFATLIGEGIAVTRHPDVMKQTQLTLVVPPLEMFLPAFVSWVYWLVCIYKYHKILASVPGWKHPISPARAVGFHFIPLFYLAWFFIWPRAIAKFVNTRLKQPVMRGWVVGLTCLAALFCQIVFDPAVGITVLFLGTGYLASCLTRALAVPMDAPQA